MEFVLEIFVIMIRNYLITALRNFSKSSFFSVTNILGLAIGLTAVLFIFLKIYDEFTFDRHHKKSDRIYRQIKKGKEFDAPIQTGAFMEFQRSEVKGVEEFTMIKKNDYSVKSGELLLGNQDFLICDTGFFDIFSYETLVGDPKKALRQPNSVILTESTAHRYFGDKDPMGQELFIENSFHAYVQAVIKDWPRSSFVQFDGILSIQFVEENNPSALTMWTNSSFQFFSLLYPGAHPDSVAREIEKSWERNCPNENMKTAIRLQALGDVHLKSENIRWEIEPQGSITNVRILGFTAILILLLACINFINLTTAQNSKRYLEIGLRKTLGAQKGHIIRQFLLETSIYVTVSVVIALMFYELLFPYADGIMGYMPPITLLFHKEIILFFFLFIVLMVLLSGAYPSFVLSSYSPNAVLKGKGSPKIVRSRSLSLRDILLLFQFLITIVLLTSAFFVQKQFDFLSQTHPGFDMQQKIVVSNPWDDQMMQRFDNFKAKAEAVPGVNGSSGTHNVPGRFQNNYSFFTVKGQPQFEGHSAAVVSVEPDFFRFMDAKIVEGDDFPENLSIAQRDSNGVCIINEAFANILKNNGVQHLIDSRLDGFWDFETPRKIQGIVKDMHFRSMHNSVFPAVFIISREAYPNYNLNIVLDVNQHNMSQSLDKLEKAWSEIAPQWPFDFIFLDQEFARLYRKEKQLASLIRGFTLLAFIISLVGLLSIVMLSFQSRLREIGIRKTLGASEHELRTLLSWRFIRLVLLANMISIPIAFVVIRRWLESFAYHINMQWWVFALAALISLGFTFLIVLMQTWRYTRVNPVDVLKYE